MVRLLRDIFYGYHRNIYVMMVSWLLFRIIYGGAEPFLPNYISVMGGSEAIIGVIYSIGSIIAIPLLLIGGIIGDYFGRRNIIVWFTSILAITYLLYFLATNWLFILLGLIIANLTALYRPSLGAIIGDSLKIGERARGYLVLNVIPEIIAIPAPLIMGFIIDLYGIESPSGYKIIYLISFILVLIIVAIRWRYLEETLRPVNHDISVVVKETISSRFGWNLLTKASKGLIIWSGLVGISDGLYGVYLIRYAYLVGITGKMWGLMLSLMSISIVIISILSAKIIDKIDPRELALLSYIFKSLALLLFISGKLYFMSLSLIFLGLLTTASMVGRQTYFVNNTSLNIRARAMGLLDLTTTIGLSIGFGSAAIILHYLNNIVIYPIYLAIFITILSGLIGLTLLPKSIVKN